MNFSIINELLIAIFVGIIQGVTEFLPVSSTAHIRLITSLIAGGRDIGLVSSNIIQLGTLVAVFQYFWLDIKKYFYRLSSIITDGNKRYQFIYNANQWVRGGNNFNGEEKDYETDIQITQLIIGTLPIIIIGLFSRNFAGSIRSLENIALYLIAGSVLMGYSEFVHSQVEKNYKKAKPKLLMLGEVLIVGLYQSLAIFPGISRSGATIAGALMLGRGRKQSVRFSFLLSLPAILLAGIIDSLDYIIDFISNPVFIPSEAFWSDNFISLSLISLILSAVAAYFIGFVCLKWLIKYLGSNPTKYFIVYRVVLALIIIILGLFNII